MAAPVNNPTPARRSMSALEHFTVGCLGVRVGVTSEVAGLFRHMLAMNSPMLEVLPECPSTTAVRVDVVHRFSAIPTPPNLPNLRLRDDGPVFTLLCHDHTGSTVLRHGEKDSTAMLITARPAHAFLELTVDADTEQGLRGVNRMLRFALGASLSGRGVPFLHAAAVAQEGRAVLLLGPQGCGKSTLAFLAATRADCAFVSDDTVAVSAAGPSATSLTVRGWPKRLAISVDVLAEHPRRDHFVRTPMRRQDNPAVPTRGDPPGAWSAHDRVRLAMDPDEFLAASSVDMCTDARPTGVLLPTADPTCRRWEITPVSEAGQWVADYELHGTERRHLTDYLGLLPTPRREEGIRAAALAVLSELPVARVRYGPAINNEFPAFWAEAMAALDLTMGR